MPTNVYVSNPSAVPLTLELVQLGPDPDFDSNYTLNATSVPAGAADTQVLGIGRGPMFADKVGMAELRFSAAGNWVGSLVLLLTPENVVKNALNWGFRGPGRELSRMGSSRDETSLQFSPSAMSIRLAGHGQASGLFDDIYLDVKVETGAVWTKIVTANDPATSRTVLFAVDANGHPTLMAAPFGQPRPQFAAIPVAPSADALTPHAVAFESEFDSSQPLWVGAVTTTGKLWLQRTDAATSYVLDLQAPPQTTIAALVVSDAFTSNGTYRAEVFLVVQNADSSFNLHVRSIQLSAAPAFLGTWADWGKVLSKRPSYVRAKDTRYLFAARPTTILSTMVQYCTASPRLSDYGSWWNTRDLPNAATTNQVLGMSWGMKGSHKEIAVACRGSDGLLYAAGGDNAFSWQASTLRPVGDEMLTIEGSNAVPIVFRDAATRTLWYTRFWVKENYFDSRSGSLSPAAAPSSFSAFYYNVGLSGPSNNFVIYQDIATGGVVLNDSIQ